MLENKMPTPPADWEGHRYSEIESHGLGLGFVLFDHIGDSLRGIVRTWFKTRYGPAVAFELVGLPNVSVWSTVDAGDRRAVEVKAGDLVNVSLTSVDLSRKLTTELVDRDVGIQYTHDVTTKAGAMKVYRVAVFDTEVSRYA